MIGTIMPYTKFTPFKKGSSDHFVMSADHVFGVIKTEYLDKNYIHSCYGSLPFTSDFDALPLVVRMWLKVSKWKQMLELAHSMDCDDDYDAQILYSDVIEADDESMLTSPLIITNGSIAVCLAPKVVSFDEFEIVQQTDISDVIDDPGFPWSIVDEPMPKEIEK